MEWLNCLNFIQLILVFTSIYAYNTLSFGKKANAYLFAILILFIIAETAGVVITATQTYTSLQLSILTVLHTILWGLILKDQIGFPKVMVGLLISFVLFCVFNLFFLEGWVHFNYYSFVLGAFLYLTCFIIDSFDKLKNENFTYFFSNDFILLMSPIFYFICMSAMFGFKSRELTSTLVFGKVKLFTVIIYFVNFVYYLLLNIYIYREKKLTNEF